MNKLSYSQLNRYLKCSYSHFLHYNKRLRPNKTSAALMFGSALDEAINVLLKAKMENKPADLSAAQAAFVKKWETGWINNKPVALPFSSQIVYADADIDLDLLTNNEWSKIFDAQDHLGYEESLDATERFEIVKAEKKAQGWANLDERDKQFYNYVAWLSLFNKAGYIIAGYMKEILPKIKRVISIQKPISLKNSDGDEVIGFIDIIVELFDGKIYVLDNKSASREYEEDAVEHSAQLALYTLAESIDNAGFVVYLKSLTKNKTKECSVCGHDGTGRQHKTCNNEMNGRRCDGAWIERFNPEARFQFLTGPVNKNLENMVLENANMVNDMIKRGIFVRNLSECTNWYGQPCPYINHCYKNDNSDLEQVD